MKKLSKLLVALALAATLTGCGSSSSSSDDKVINVGATAVPHAEILNDVVKDVLKKDGWELKVTEFTDYVLPNTSLESDELDANYFQTLAYLEEQNESRSLHLKAVAGIHYEAMALYSNKIKNKSDLKDGDTIAIPNDGSNEDRALNLLAKNGLIELKGKKGSYNLQSISSNPHKYEFKELDSANIANNLPDVTAAVVNGNYALEHDLGNTSNVLFSENFTDEEAAPYINYLVVKEGNENTEKTKALIKALQSDEVKSYCEKYNGAVVTKFVDVK